jgi:23S rRNA (cytidine1920-2'-O)/16S rRNA (cytidine1409-2'-O)-methyltransferase
MPKERKGRIDKLLVERGFISSRERSRALIMAGEVIVDGMVIEKPGTAIPINASISLKEKLPYVSRGGIKLEGALNHFGINVKGMVIIDIGSSTGGFTDCLLKRGAEKVFAVDVGTGLLDWKIRNDRRVEVLEGRNIRYLGFEEIPEPVDLAVIDVSFISLDKVIPKAREFLNKCGCILALIKPQFEVGRGQVGKGGIVRDPEKHKMVIEKIKTFIDGLGLDVKGVFESPIKGTKGNREFWIFCHK